MGWDVSTIRVLGQWVCHSGPYCEPLGELVLSTSLTLFAWVHISCLVRGLHGVWCFFMGAGMC